jgi:hypothetical protein
MTWQMLEADCVEAMAAMPAASVDAICTDPPYGLGFMGKEWDTIGDTGRGAHARSERAAEVTPNGQGHSTSGGPYLAAGVDSLRSAGAPYQRWCEAWAREALRVLKPGGHLLAFGGTRTYHRLTCAIEDAGFEIRDCLAWQHMESVFCGCDDPRRGDGRDDVRGVRGDVQDVAADSAPGEAADVLPSVQRPASRCGVGEARPQGRGGAQAEAGHAWPEESRLEGRCDVEAPEGQLSRGAVREGADVGAADGEGGRLRDGASASDGAAGRAPVGANGGSASPGPRSGEQCAEQSGALAVEWIPQGGGAWPGCPRCGKPLAPPFFGGPLSWEYGSGFPKSLDVSKAIDKAAGAEREVVGRYQPPNGKTWNLAADESRPGDGGTMGAHRLRSESMDRTAPATPDAEHWQGWGTALKPAHEPIVLARKPLSGTVAATVLAHGTGALNVDGCRIGTTDAYAYPNGAGGNTFTVGGGPDGSRTEPAESNPLGRWPANVVLDPEAAAMLDEQTGELTSGAKR